MYVEVELTYDEYNNLRLFEKYNNLIYDTECKIYEMTNECIDISNYTEYINTLNSIKESYPNLSENQQIQLYDIMENFIIQINKIIKEIEKQVNKGACCNVILDYIYEWLRIPSDFPLGNRVGGIVEF